MTATSLSQPDNMDVVRGITVVTGGTGPASSYVTALSAVPTRAGAQVTFTLSAPAALDARVRNMAGRPVRTLCASRSGSAGANALLWDARDDGGLPVPAGVYLVEVVAHSENGAQARALTQVRLTR